MPQTHTKVGAANSPEALLVRELAARGLKIAVAESCTGGYVAKRITDISGASQVLDGSIVTYANHIKEKFLHVSRETLSKYGAVSGHTALEMARGVRELFDADVGVSLTGIAGPTGGSPKKPVGTVFLSISMPGRQRLIRLNIGDGDLDRETIRNTAATNALVEARRFIKHTKQPDQTGREEQLAGSRSSS